MSGISVVKDILKKARDQKEKSSNKRNFGPRTAFLPEGRHKIRWVLDPNETMYREVKTFRVDKERSMDPTFWRSGVDPKGNEIPDTPIYEYIGELDNWRVNPRFEVLIYGYLYDTDSKSDFWEPGNFYLIVGNSKMRDAVLSFMQDLVEDSPDYLMSSINHNLAGNPTSVTVIKGQGGSVTVSPTMSSPEDPIKIDDTFKPLEESYVANEYEHEKHMKVLAHYEALVEEKRKKENPEGAKSEDSKSEEKKEETPPKEEPKSEETPKKEEEKKEEAPAKEEEKKADPEPEKKEEPKSEEKKEEPKKEDAPSGNTDEDFWKSLGLEGGE